MLTLSVKMPFEKCPGIESIMSLVHFKKGNITLVMLRVVRTNNHAATKACNYYSSNYVPNRISVNH